MNTAEKIYGKKVTHGKVYYYIKWKGRPESENSWALSENITNIVELLESSENNTFEEVATVKMRKGSFSTNDEVKKVVQIVWNEDTNESMGEIEWKSSYLYNSLYSLPILHEKCPKEMCEAYHSLLKFTYTP